MGSGHSFECKKCGYEFTAVEGVGFMFPAVYAELVEEGKKGELGEELKIFFEEYPDGAIDAKKITVRCYDCGNYENVYDLTMYVPNKAAAMNKDKGRWSVALPFEDASYVTSLELKKSYTEYKKYHHSCDKCGEQMIAVDINEDAELVCPECGEKLEYAGELCWD